MATAMQELTGEDAVFGYVFGCDGLRNKVSAAKFIDVSVRTMDDYIKDPKIPIRARKDPATGRVKVCARSLKLYIDNLV